MVKSNYWSYKGSRFHFQHLPCGFEPILISVLEDMAPSLDLQRHQAHMWHTYIHEENIITNQIIDKK